MSKYLENTKLTVHFNNKYLLVYFWFEQSLEKPQIELDASKYKFRETLKVSSLVYFIISKFKKNCDKLKHLKIYIYRL